MMTLERRECYRDAGGQCDSNLRTFGYGLVAGWGGVLAWRDAVVSNSLLTGSPTNNHEISSD
jgi:hypothetical protein